MRHAPNRRDVLRAAVGGGAAACAFGGWSAFAQDVSLRATPLSDNLLWIDGAGGNVVVGATPDGLLMIDGGLESRSAALLDFVRRETGESRIHTLINTHWHPEQTGSNLALGEAGAAIVAHENTRLWLSHDFYVRWQDRNYEALPLAAQPKRTFYETLDLPFGASQAQLGYMLQAHTDGDIYVHFPDENVIVTGGVGSTDGWPVLDWGTGGWIIGLMDGLDAVAAHSDDATKILPASGPLVPRASVLEQRVMFEALQKEILRLIRLGQSVEEVIERRITAPYEAQWGDPEQFLRLTYKGMVMQMRGHRMRIA